MLTGCLSLPDANASYHAETSLAAQPTNQQLSLTRCQSEVSALAQYDDIRFQHQHDTLNSLMDRSAKYLLTRPQLAADMQATLDSVYQAELAKRCQQIHSELFRAMLAQADGE
ncbi:hypothetical protein [Pantoea sp. CTOTU49201]|uniref:hypothetical protein n=1 Tax=Pantoea sp. CTOTU49201 TaxID=2953855 RepID=UPI00289E0192|nr:hypothetical protein [Pantoea sp. CTOTU49201]